MKYLKFTYVDASTGISIASHPATNGPVFPAVTGLEFAWARESRYPANVPEFFGTCPDSSDTQLDGVLGLFSATDWEAMRADEMLSRSPVPQTVTMRQGRLALLAAGLLDDVDAALAAIPDATQRRAAQIEWEYAQTIDRQSAWVANLSAALSLPDAQLDALFVQAAAL